MITYISSRMDRILRTLLAILMTAVSVALTIATLRGRSGLRSSFWYVLAALYCYVVYIWVGLAIDLVRDRRDAAVASRPPTSPRREVDLSQIIAIRSSGTIDSLFYGGILLARHKIALVERDIETRSVAQDDVDSVTLAYGVASTHPIVTLVIGVAVVLVGLVPILMIPILAATGQRVPIVAIAWLAIVIPGGWIVRESVRKRLLLRIATPSRVVILSFDRGVDPGTVRAFAHYARRELGMVITIDDDSLRQGGL